MPGFRAITIMLLKTVTMFLVFKFVCMGGTSQRMENFAHFIMREIQFRPPPGTCLEDMSRHSYR